MTTSHSAYIDTAAIKAEYAPYNRFPLFEVGYIDGLYGMWTQKGLTGVDAQAYDRGLEAGNRVHRETQWAKEHVR